MAVTTTNVSDTFTGDGATLGPFPYTFDSQLASDIQVYLGGVLQTTGYTITPNTNPDNSTAAGGNVFFTSPPKLGIAGIIQRAVPLQQNLTLGVEQALNEVSITNTFDRLVMMIQERSAQIGAALSVPLQILASGFSLIIQGINPLYVLRVNAAGDGLEAVSAAQALAQSQPLPGGGTVVNVNAGPLSSKYRVAIANDTTGQFIDYIDDTAASVGNSIIWQGANVKPVWGPAGGGGSGALLKAANIAAPGRQIPTSGAVSGTYTHFGNLTLSGNLSASGPIKLFINGNLDFNGHTLSAGTTFLNAQGAQGNLMTAQSGSGPGGANCTCTFAANVAGGGGGGGAGSGGAGGSATAHLFNSGGGNYDWREFFGSSGGGGGNCTGANPAFGGQGGLIASGIYLEVTGTIAFSASSVSIAAGGGGGIAGSATTQGAGGGSSGPPVVVRCGGAISGGWAANNTIIATGGNGGNSGGTGGGGGGGGGGWIDVQSVGANTAVGSFAVTGGTAGTGSATTPAANGQPGSYTMIQNTTVISEF